MGITSYNLGLIANGLNIVRNFEQVDFYILMYRVLGQNPVNSFISKPLLYHLMKLIWFY